MTSNYPPGVSGNEPQITGEWIGDGHDVPDAQWFDVRRRDNASIGTWEELGDAIEQAVREYNYSHKGCRVLADDGTLIGESGDFAPDGFRWEV